MKTHQTLSTAVALALSAWSLTAQENPARAPGVPERPPGPPREGAQRRDEPRREEPRREVQRPMPGLFNALDTNHDGVIDATEIAQAAEVLRRLDKNGDGRITPDEWRTAVAQPREGEGRRPQVRDGEAGRPKQPDGERRGGGDAGNSKRPDGDANRGPRPDGARHENHPGAPAPGQSRGPEQGRSFDQRGQQPNPQIAQHHENRGPAQPDRGARQQPGSGQPGNFHPPNFTQRAPGPDAPRNPGPQANPQFGHNPGQHHDSFASGHPRRGNPQQGQPGAPNQGRGFDRGGQQPNPQFAQRHENRGPAQPDHGARQQPGSGQSGNFHPPNFAQPNPQFAQRGGPQQPGDPRPHRMAQNDRGPGGMGPRPPQHDGPQVHNFNGPRTLQIAPQFGGMNRPFGMMDRQRGPGPQPGAQPPGPGAPQPQPGFRGPPNPPGPQGWEAHQHHQHQHHEHGPRPQPEGGRPPGPPPPQF